MKNKAAFLLKWLLFGVLTFEGLIILAWARIDEGDIQMSADKVDFDYETGVSQFSGNVKIQYQNTLLEADAGKMNTSEKKAEAEGNVMILDNDKLFFCESVEYAFNENSGLMRNGITMDEAWILRGKHVEQLSKNQILILKGSVTQCHSLPPSHKITAKRIEVTVGETLIARHVIFWIGPIPVLYTPYLKRNLKDDQQLFRLDVGHRDNFGFELFTDFRLPTPDPVEAHLLFDWYEERGMGVGADVRTTYDRGWAKTIGYFIQDDQFLPTRSDEEEGKLDRYRLTLEQAHTFPNSWRSKLDLNLVSDIDFTDDFFASEFDDSIQVYNRYRFFRNTEKYSAGLRVRTKLNDFYNVLERLPQLEFNLLTAEVMPDTNLYFDSSNQVVSLNQDFIGDRTEQDASRFHSSNNLRWSHRYFGWLVVSPALQGEGTWYSKSPEPVFVDEERVVPDMFLEDGITPVTETVSVLAYEEGGSLTRFSGTASLDLSTTLYKLYDRKKPLWGLNRLRHVITPQVKYRYRPTPTEENIDVYQFDEIDNRQKRNTVTLGSISRWQGKSGNDVITLFNTRYSVTYDLEDKDFGFFSIDSNVRLHQDFYLDYRADWNTEDSELDKFRTDFSWRLGERAGVGLGYIYRKYKDNIVTPEVSVRLGEELFVRGYLYYNETQSLVERVNLSLVKSFAALDLGVHYQEREYRDEKSVYFSLAPKLLPSGSLRIGY